MQKEERRYTWVWLLSFVLVSVILYFVLPWYYNVPLFIFVLFPIILFLLIKWPLKRFFLSLLLAIALWILLVGGTVAIGAYVITKDVKEIGREIQEDPKFLLYESNNAIKWGVQLTGNSSQGVGGSLFTPLTQTQVEQIKSQRTIKDSHEVIITIKPELFQTLPEDLNFSLGDQSLKTKKSDLLKILEGGSSQALMQQLIKNTVSSQLPTDQLNQIPQLDQNNSDLSSAGQQLPPEFASQAQSFLSSQTNMTAIPDEQMRALILVGLGQKLFEKNGQETIFNAYKEGYIQYAPDHFTLRLVRMVPAGVVADTIKNFIPSNN